MSKNTENQISHDERNASGTLWNSAMGRRVFLKKTGAASVATAVALHGFRVQVQAQVTGGQKYYLESSQTQTATFRWSSAQNAKPSDATIASQGDTQVLSWNGGTIEKAWFDGNTPGNPATSVSGAASGGAVWKTDSNYGHGGYWLCTVTRTKTWNWK